MIKNIFLLCMICSSVLTFAQESEKPEKVFQTFKDTRVINAHSVETLGAGILDFRVGHRFGDIAGAAGGWETFWGLENASDILFGFEYGMTDNFMVGISRSKGNGPLRQNVNGLAKIRIATQEKHGQPMSIAVLGLVTGSTMKKSQSESDLNYFTKTEHRFSYHAEFMVARKVSNYFSFQVSGAWTYRNIVPNGDKNDIASVGFTSRLQMNKALALILDGRYVFSEIRTPDNGYYAPIAIGLEWETGGGHVFQINLTNATGLIETDYIPYTKSNWLDGEFRLGFTIGRQFRI